MRTRTRTEPWSRRHPSRPPRSATVWLTDPTGAVTEVTDRRIGSLSGPWASWELREEGAGDRPAGFQEIWAG